jgi:hypothetical protein
MVDGHLYAMVVIGMSVEIKLYIMKKLMILFLFLLIPFLGFSQIQTDTTFSTSQVKFELTLNNSYQVKYINDSTINVEFQWVLKKYIDGELTKNETHTEVVNIAGTQFQNILLSATIINGLKSILETRKKQLTLKN